MQALLWVVSSVLVLGFAIWQLLKPWLTYHSSHIEPFENAIEVKAKQLQAVQSERQLALREAAQFLRDFSLEIKNHQSVKSAAYLKLNPLKEEKAELHQKMERVREALQSWHQSSKSFWGNKSRKIKEDSILGWFGLEQTVAQKEGLESRRASIHARIGQVKTEMDEIFLTEIAPAKLAIDALFAEREAVAEERRNGRSDSYWKDIASKKAIQAAAISNELDTLRVKLKSAEEGYKHWKKRQS